MLHVIMAVVDVSVKASLVIYSGFLIVNQYYCIIILSFTTILCIIPVCVIYSASPSHKIVNT